MNNKDIQQKSLKRVKQITQKIFLGSECRVLLFGSRAKKNHRPGADFDLCVLGDNCQHLILKLSEELEESDIPFEFDILHIDEMSEDFRKEALKHTEIIYCP